MRVLDDSKFQNAEMTDSERELHSLGAKEINKLANMFIQFESTLTGKGVECWKITCFLQMGL